MNIHMERWIKEAVLETDGEFTAKTILTKIGEKKGSSPYIGSVTGIGWVLGKLDNVEQICKGHSSKTYRRIKNDD